MSTATIRRATRADAGVLLALIRELAEYEQLSHQVAATEADLQRALFCEHPAAEALLAEADGEVAGFALFFHNFSTFAGRRGLYLEDLFVRPEFRRQGIGRALLVDVARIARERGCGRMEWAVLDWNQSAIEFYGQIGARVLPDWRITRLDAAGIEHLSSLSAQ